MKFTGLNHLLAGMALLALVAGCSAGSSAPADTSGPAFADKVTVAPPLPAEAGQPGQLDLIPLPGDAGAEQLSLPAPDPALLAELSEMLERELSAAGKDISSTETKAPTGEGNGLMFVSPFYKRHGTGADQEYLVTLYGSEFLQGDYDGNGIVNAADLVMIAHYWQASVSYFEFDATRHNFPIPHEPAGISDGNFDGIVNASDITVIAQHWLEQLDGYRIFISMDKVSEYRLPDGTYPESSMTLTRGAEYYIDLDILLDLDPDEGYTYYSPSDTGARRSRRRFYYTAVFRGDSPASLRIAPVNLESTPQQGSYTELTTPVDVMPLIQYSAQLSDSTVPTHLTIDFSGSTDDIPDTGRVGFLLRDALGNQVDSQEDNFYQTKIFTSIVFHNEPYELELHYTDIYGNNTTESTQITPQGDSVINDNGWSLAHTGLFLPEPVNDQIAADLGSVAGRPALACIGLDNASQPAVLYLRASDASGTVWPSPVNVADMAEFDQPDSTQPFVQLHGGSGSPAIGLMDTKTHSPTRYGRVWFYGAADPDGSDFAAGQQFLDLDDYLLAQPDGRLRLLWTDKHNTSRLAVESMAGSLVFDNLKLEGEDAYKLGTPNFLTLIGAKPVYFYQFGYPELKLVQSLNADGNEVAASEVLACPQMYMNIEPIRDGDAVQYFTRQTVLGGSSKYNQEFLLATVGKVGADWQLEGRQRQFGILNTSFAKYNGIHGFGILQNFSCRDSGQLLLVYPGDRGELMYVRTEPGETSGIGRPHRIILPAAVDGYSALDAQDIDGVAAILAIDNVSGELVYIRRS